MIKDTSNVPNKMIMHLLFIINRLSMRGVKCGSVENRQQLWNYSTVGRWDVSICLIWCVNTSMTVWTVIWSFILV